MAVTYESIATTTLGSASATITFSSIPNAYTDLRAVLVLNTDAGATIFVKINGDSSVAYSSTVMYGNGTTATSSRETSVTRIKTLGWLNGPLSATSSWRGMVTADVANYTAGQFKTLLITWSNDQNGSGDVGRSVGLYRSTSAVTSLTFETNGANFVVGTTATLYGIKAA